MHQANSRRGWRILWALGGLAFALLLAVFVVHFLLRSHDLTQSGVRPLPSPTAAPPATVAAESVNRPPGGRKTAAASLLQLASDWQRQHPIQRALIDTSVAGVETSRAEVFKYPDETGALITRVKFQLLRPGSATVILQRARERILAYFPELNQVVEMDPKQDLARLPGLEGDHHDFSSLLKLARASFVETSPGFKTVTLALAPGAMGLPGSAGETLLSVKVEPAGRVLGVEVLRLGQRAVSTFTYLSFDALAVSNNAPALPGANIPVTRKPFVQVLQEEIDLIMKKRPASTI